MAEIGSAQQIFQQVERRRVEPLQVIEEQRQGMFRPSEDTDELPKHQLKAPLRVLRRKLRNGRWLSTQSVLRSVPALAATRRAKAQSPLRFCRAAAG